MQAINILRIVTFHRKNINSICLHFISSELLKLTIEYLINSLKDSGSFLLFLKIL